jgi:zinc transporter, ZIP family
MLTGVLLAFAITLLAGLSTAVGGALGVLGRGDSHKTLALGLGVSAGVMIYVSLVELLPQGRSTIAAELGAERADWVAVVAFFGGIAVIAVIDRLVPSELNPHEPGATRLDERRRRLMRTGLVSAAALAIHNLPEGFATFIAALQAPEIAGPVAVAIAIHNIPEGVAVAVPIHQATGSRWKGFWYSAASGLAEPVGALVGYLVLAPFLTDSLLGIVFCGIAGIMVFISLDELLPTAEEYGEHHLAIYGLILGMGVMAVSLLLL